MGQGGFSRALRTGFTCGGRQGQLAGHFRRSGGTAQTSFEKRWKAAQVNDAVVFVNGSGRANLLEL